MSTRIEKVNSLLEHEISKILVRDFSFSGALVTLTHVDTSPNLIQARVYISVMPEPARNASHSDAGGDKTDHVIGVLNKGVHDVQKKINKMVNMRPVPKIRFVRDKEILEAAKIEAILEKIKEEKID